MPNILFNLIFILGGFFLIYFLLKKEIEKISLKKEEESFRLSDIQKTLMESFNLLKNEVSEHFKTTIEKQSQIVETSSKLEEIARSLEAGAEEISSVKEILAGPKQRGYFGEIMLEEILKNLPSSFYEKQYPLGIGLKVDYVLKINNTIIPIDSKFPYHNFSNLENNKENLKKELIKNLKLKIEEISKKYITPSRGTVEFAVLYLANEGLYYEILSDKIYDEIWEFAREKSVFITSPKTFELICSSLLLTLRKQQLSENIKEVLDNLHQLEKDLNELEQKFETSYTQLNNSFKNLQEVSLKLIKFTNSFRNLIKTDRKLEEKIKERSLI